MTKHLLFDQIRHDHRDIAALCGDLEAASSHDDREERRDALVAAVRAHLAATETVVYSALDRVPAAAPSVDRLASQHKGMLAAAEALAHAPLADDAYVGPLRRLRALITAHFDESDHTLFTLAEQHLEPATLEMLAVEFEDARQRERGSYGV
jgi:Hemerythrin HHE cation binding domain